MYYELYSAHDLTTGKHIFAANVVDTCLKLLTLAINMCVFSNISYQVYGIVGLVGQRY